LPFVFFKGNKHYMAKRRNLQKVTTGIFTRDERGALHEVARERAAELPWIFKYFELGRERPGSMMFLQTSRWQVAIRKNGRGNGGSWSYLIVK